MVMCDSKSQEWIPKGCVQKEIGVSAQDMITFLGFKVYWRDMYDHLVSKKIFTLIMNKIFM